jgi:RNA polymerase sigma-70 factor (ECF subfamily)
MAAEPDDATLVAEIAAGGPAAGAAEATLCRRFAPRIRLYGLRHLRDDERARDLVQLVLLAVLEAARAGRIHDPTRLDRYVLGTCRNTAARVRERERRIELGADLDALAAVEHAPVAVAPLLRCLEGLDERSRQVVLLTFQAERSAGEIAGLLALSATNVRVVRHRALASLRRCLDAGAPP